MREQRKFVTVLAGDVVGSTALGERLDPEDVRLVVGGAIERMIAAVEDLGGTVKDLAGDGLFALFGAPVTHEDDPERAVRTALRIIREILEYAGEVEQGWGIAGFTVRIGIASGLAVLGPVGGGSRIEYGATGDVANTAARLQSCADPGTVLVEASTARLIEPLFEWGEARSLTLKGKAEPVTAYPAMAPVQVPGKVRGLRGAGAQLVGRDAELAAAWTVVQDVLAGTGGVLFVTGEAGIGKSRLLAELRSRFETSDSPGGPPTWLEGQCASY